MTETGVLKLFTNTPHPEIRFLMFFSPALVDFASAGAFFFAELFYLEGLQPSKLIGKSFAAFIFME